MAQAAHIVGQVEYREGDGPQILIRPGPIEVTTTHNDATLSWSDGDSNGSAAMPLADFKRFVADGAIKMDSPLTVPAVAAMPAPAITEPAVEVAAVVAARH